MTIGLLGLVFNVGNKGCQALSYSFLEILNQIAFKHDEKYKVKIITTFPTRVFLKNRCIYLECMECFAPRKKYSNLEIGFCFYRDFMNRFLMTPNIKKCDMVFDFTAGDSFTDIYGKERFYSRTRLKKAIIDRKIPLVLGSQTIGPFQDDNVKAFAAEVINESTEVFVRDEMSYRYTKEISGRTPILTTDIAFFLDYTKQSVQSDKIKMGFNVSGLLWNEAEKYRLTVDYRRYCKVVLQELLDLGKYDIYLIAHAFTKERVDLADNDFTAIEALKDEYPQVSVAPYYESCRDVKGFIADMDVFIGARMHATIAAFSAGVADIPFSYSRKFEGLYDSLSYPYVIHGCSDTTEQAITKTIEWINCKDTLANAVQQSISIVAMKSKALLEATEQLLYSKL